MDLEFKKVTKKFDDFIAIDDVSFHLTSGIYGLLGANGSGKTTLFRIITGLLKPNQGNIYFNHQELTKHNENEFRSILGFLPQDFSYYPNFTGWEFMLYIAALKGLHPKTAKKKCEELLDLVGLASEKNKKTRTYSGGMKQRLGIAQALINNPKILILDEPTVGLDPKERVRFRNLLSSLSKDKIIILSTHIVSDVEYIADEILILKHGKIENRGTTESLVQDIENKVWKCVVPSQLVDDMSEKYVISNQKSDGNNIQLRIVSSKKPIEKAELVTPILEDLYLYYFRGERIK